MEFFMCFLILLPHKKGICLFLLILSLKSILSKKYCVICKTDACVLILLQCSIYRGRGVGKRQSPSSCDGILNVPPPVMAASPCFFLTCFLMLPPHLQSLVIICLSSHFLPGKNQFLLSGRNFIRNSFLASLLLQPAMPPDRYPQILFSNSFCLNPRPVSCIICSRIRRTTMIVITSAKSERRGELMRLDRGVGGWVEGWRGG